MLGCMVIWLEYQWIGGMSEDIEWVDFNGARGQMVVVSGKWVYTRPPECIKCDEIREFLEKNQQETSMRSENKEIRHNVSMNK